MQFKDQTRALFLVAITLLLLNVPISQAQEDTTPKKRLRSPATARGFIGGESHDSYVIRARKGQTMTVRISWRPEGDNSAGFSITGSRDFFAGEPINFGNATDDGKSWTGKIPRTGNYYIYVTAHPTARYVLRVRLK
jgi:hypothetical protein